MRAPHRLWERLAGDLSRDEAHHILGFLGYGRLSAPFWFIGLEEGLSSLDPSDLAQNLKARGSWDEVMDLERALLSLRHEGRPIRITVKPPRTPTWRWMCRIVVEIAQKLGLGDRPAAREYLRHRLGRSDPQLGETFLTELSPIPSKNTAQNQTWLRAFRGVATDCDQLIRARRERLRTLLQQHRPKFVFCYGAETERAESTFRSVFSVQKWRSVGNKCKISQSGGQWIALMPFFGLGRLTNLEFEAVIDGMFEGAPDGA